MALFKQSTFTATGIKSLCWRGDELVDWVGGGRSFAVDGTERDPKVSYRYRFDAATASPDGRFAVIYQRVGTKGLLLHDGRILRELERSSYFADAYEYPVSLFNGPDGRVLLAHCPRDYRRIDLEDAETGLPLTESADRELSDFFHSRLAVSPDGQRLLSAGWVWHPLGLVVSFDVAQALTDPSHLDDGQDLPPSFGPGLVEENSSCWLDDHHLAVAVSVMPDRAAAERDEEPRSGMAVYDAIQRTCLQAFQLDEPAGTIMALGERFVLSLYRHPKLIDLSTGKVVHMWTELRSGLQDGSIIWGLDGDAVPPPMAFDAATKRFAIVNGDTITRIEFDLAER
ncbi:hypothetical protein [Mesorhizobium sp. GbtcB19]|uniref:hypothetical protein n=1 Tax=Mesorhizobium sp. GbtcB19 TaxID=2824764 RepID=UPI001C30542E|nr:hypothetical protein [Mesorhizobium sp. GbtcB19]